MKLLLLVLVALCVLVAGGLAIVNFALDKESVETHTIAGDVREIVVRADSGDVDLVPAGSRVVVRETRHYVFEQPKLEQSLEGGVLMLDTHCDGFALHCSTDLRIAVPAGVKVSVAADSGDIDARRVALADPHLEADSGDVSLGLTGRQGRVFARADSGDVDVVAPGARAIDAQADSGDVHVVAAGARAIDARADSGDVEIEAGGTPRRIVAETDSGDVEVTAPAGSYAVQTETDSGDVDVDAGIGRNDRAPQSISAKADSGDVSLRAR